MSKLDRSSRCVPDSLTPVNISELYKALLTQMRYVECTKCCFLFDYVPTLRYRQAWFLNAVDEVLHVLEESQLILSGKRYPEGELGDFNSAALYCISQMKNLERNLEELIQESLQFQNTSKVFLSILYVMVLNLVFFL